MATHRQNRKHQPKDYQGEIKNGLGDSCESSQDKKA